MGNGETPPRGGCARQHQPLTFGAGHGGLTYGGSSVYSDDRGAEIFTDDQNSRRNREWLQFSATSSVTRGLRPGGRCRLLTLSIFRSDGCLPCTGF